VPSKAPTKPQADPLADLRAPDAEPGVTDSDLPEPEPFSLSAPADFHAAKRAEIVTAFHGDTVAAGALHKGGTCACRYLATLAVKTMLGAPVEAPESTESDDEAEGGAE